MSQENQYYDMDSLQNAAGGSKQKPASKDGRGAFVWGMVVGMLAALLIVGSVFLIGRAVKPKEKDKNFTIKLPGISSTKKEDGTFVDEEMTLKLESLAELIHDEFYLKDMTDEELRNGVYKGLMESLGDPYSEYYTPEEFQEMMTNSSGIYYGVGAYLSLDSEAKLPKISSVISGAPAEEVGLRANDLIYMVNGVSVYGMTLNEAVKLIKGEENTQVVLTILRDGDQMDIAVTRRKVESPTVKSEMLENGMGYLQITEFDEITSSQFVTALDELKAQNMKGLILDLRENPGGNLATVVQIAQNLLPEGIIVYTEDKAGKRVTYRSKGDKELQVPMVVLVDMNSASASEILAGAIQDYKKGTLIGTTTYGKGIVQSVQPMVDGSAIKITISSYFTPNGRNIHGIGIEPDIVCEFDGSNYYNVENPVDNQLEKAKEVLAGMIK